MIHVALFSFQRTTLSFEALASSDSFIVPHLVPLVKKFLFLFSSVPRRFPLTRLSFQTLVRGGRISQRLVLYYRIVTELSTAFLKKSKKRRLSAKQPSFQLQSAASCLPDGLHHRAVILVEECDHDVEHAVDHVTDLLGLLVGRDHADIEDQ